MVQTDEYMQIFLDELYQHADALTAFAYHLTRSEVNADDLVQDTYLKAIRSIENYHAGTNGKAWLFQIMKNTFINDYRAKKRKPQQVEIEDYKGMHESDTSSPIKGYEDGRDKIDRSFGDEVTIALSELKEDQREVLWLADVEDFTYDEIAKILEVPIGTVRSKLFRARNELKAKLKDYAMREYGVDDKR
jgi:RNA polymerase sigma factor (sigma-70 family)